MRKVVPRPEGFKQRKDRLQIAIQMFLFRTQHFRFFFPRQPGCAKIRDLISGTRQRAFLFRAGSRFEPVGAEISFRTKFFIATVTAERIKWL
jgi:hypothetical protein